MVLGRFDGEVVSASSSSVSLRRVALALFLALRGPGPKSRQGGARRLLLHAWSTLCKGPLAATASFRRPWASVDFALRTAVIDATGTTGCRSACTGRTTPGGSQPTRFPLACLGHLKRAKGRRGVGGTGCTGPDRELSEGQAVALA